MGFKPADESATRGVLGNKAMYFRFCDACKCYEYDCHGLEGCIHHEPGYKNAHQRHRDRQEREKRLVELVENENNWR